MDTERESRPTCMYKNGPFGKPMSKVFDHPDDIPAGEGWVDSPAKVEKRAAPKNKRKSKTEAKKPAAAKPA